MSTWPIYNTILDNDTLQLSCKFGEFIWLTDWVVMLSSSFVLNKHGDFGQYNSYATSSKIMPCHGYPVSLVDLFNNLI